MSSPQRLTILDVGHGNSAVLESSSGVVVIDAGRRNFVLEFLREQGIKKIDLVLVSHADEDHLGGLLAIMSSGMFELGRVRLNTDSSKSTAIWDDLLYELNHLHQKGAVDFEPALSQNKTPIYEDGSIRLEVLAPSPYLAGKGPGGTDHRGRIISTNCISAVVRVVDADLPVALFPGDLDELGLSHLIESGLPLTAPVLVFPHHGGRSRGSDLAAFAGELCKLVKPAVVVFSFGRTKFFNPQPEVVAAIQQCDSRIWIACTQLSKRCAVDLPQVPPKHLSGAFAAGKQSTQCCAGTLVVELGTPTKAMLPIYDAHQDFITRSAPTALCRHLKDGASI